MTRVLVALGAGLSLTAIALVLTLSGSPLAVAHSNGVLPAREFVETSNAAEVCQGGETLPGATTAIRISISSIAGPQIRLTVRRGGRLLTSGSAPRGWTAGAITVPVGTVRMSESPVRVCFAWGQTAEPILFFGSNTAPAVAARSSEGAVLPGRVMIQYLRPAAGTWWSQAMTVARHMGLGRSPSGTWIALLTAVLMTVAVAGAYAIAARGLR